MTTITRFERWFPGLALQLIRARIRLDAAKRVYDAAKASTYHIVPDGRGRSADAVVQVADDKIRHWARHLDENYDLAIGVLDVLVNNIVGTGIVIEPMVMKNSGQAAEKVNVRIRKLLKQWAEQPEVTGELPSGEAQRLMCRTWLRDGEVLIQHIRGPAFRHRSEVPYSIELIEPDFLPFAAITGQDNVVHGVEKDIWGAPVAYHLHKTHPGNSSLPFVRLTDRDLRRVPAENIIHLKFTRRFRQTRGVSILHGVIRRLADIKDYEESERIAARVAASLTTVIKKAEDFTGQADAVTGDRSFEMQAGMIFDNLQPGEDVSMIKSDRPNQALGSFIQTNQRALAAGTGTNYSSVAKDYNGTFSAQRQEMVESQPAYARLREYFISVAIRRIYTEFIAAAVLGGVLVLPRGTDMETLFAADMRAPGLPWIDPLKEVQADALTVEQRFKSRSQIIRDRGGDPDVVEKQIAQDRERDQASGTEPVGNAAGSDADGSGDAGDGDAGDGDAGDGDAEDGDGGRAIA